MWNSVVEFKKKKKNESPEFCPMTYLNTKVTFYCLTVWPSCSATIIAIVLYVCCTDSVNTLTNFGRIFLYIAMICMYF